MARILNQSQAAKNGGDRKLQHQRRKARKVAERMAADPSYKPGAAQAEMRMFRRRKQLRRWFHDLIQRDDPRRPKFPHDVVAFNKLTKLRTDEELIEQLKGDDISPVVKDLFDRVLTERAKAAGVHEESKMEVEVEDWWGIGPEMEHPGEVVGGEEISNENGGEGEGGEDGREGEGGEDGGEDEGGEDGGESMTEKNMDKPRSSSTTYHSEEQSS